MVRIDDCLPTNVHYVSVAWCTTCDNGRGQPCRIRPPKFDSDNPYAWFHKARCTVGSKWRRDDAGRVRNETLVVSRCYCTLIGVGHCPTPERHR
jgi:hypothetical protein